MDSAKYRGVVGQRKMSSTATRKGSMSRVSPGMWWWYQQICEICNVTLTCSMVDVTSNSHRGSPGSVPRKSQTYSPLLRRNWHVKTMGGGGSRGCAQVASADSCKMRGIVADCSRLKPGASRQPAFMASCQTIASHMPVTCGIPVYLVLDELRPCVLWPLMIGLGGFCWRFFWHGEYGFTYRELMLL